MTSSQLKKHLPAATAAFDTDEAVSIQIIIQWAPTFRHMWTSTPQKLPEHM
jgi:hypothetical protein